MNTLTALAPKQIIRPVMEFANQLILSLELTFQWCQLVMQAYPDPLGHLIAMCSYGMHPQFPIKACLKIDKTNIR